MIEEKTNWRAYDGMHWDDIPKQELDVKSAYGLRTFKLLPAGTVVDVGFNYGKHEGFVFERGLPGISSWKYSRAVGELSCMDQGPWKFRAFNN